MNEAHFPRAHESIPDRWLPGYKDPMTSKPLLPEDPDTLRFMSTLAFGGGPRICPGREVCVCVCVRACLRLCGLEPLGVSSSVNCVPSAEAHRNTHTFMLADTQIYNHAHTHTTRIHARDYTHTNVAALRCRAPRAVLHPPMDLHTRTRTHLDANHAPSRNRHLTFLRSPFPPTKRVVSKPDHTSTKHSQLAKNTVHTTSTHLLPPPPCTPSLPPIPHPLTPPLFHLSSLTFTPHPLALLPFHLCPPASLSLHTPPPLLYPFPTPLTAVALRGDTDAGGRREPVPNQQGRGSGGPRGVDEHCGVCVCIRVRVCVCVCV